MKGFAALAMMAMAGSAAMASAQLVGGSARVGVGVGAPALGSTVRGTTGAIDDTVRGTADTVRDTTGAVADTTRRAARVNVHAGVSTRVDRGTRCYYQPDDYTFDPVYRDGGYYCERRTSGSVAAGAAVDAPR